MCVILDIPPNKMIPSAMLDLACDINPDGHGIAYTNKKQVVVERSIETNDPKQIADRLTKLKSLRRIVHLRFSTVGDVSLDNNHPFVVLSNKVGPQLVMMHNGTLHTYAPADRKSPISDTFCFNRHFLSPLCARSEALNGTNGVLKDMFIRALISKEVGSFSVIVLLDRFGNVVRYNGERGKQFTDFWASNDYSFDKNHHRSSLRTQSVFYPAATTRDMPWEEVTDGGRDDISTTVDAWMKKTQSAVGSGIVRASSHTMEVVTHRVEQLKKAGEFIRNKRSK